MNWSAEVGRRGEELAAEFLKRRGFKFLAKNWKTPRWGEIDLVAVDEGCLVIVEVKTRSQDDLAKPFEFVDYFKLKTLVRAAQTYRLQNPNTPTAMRIDVVSIVLTSPPKLEYFKSVFQE